jgi:NhaA family Na+:H+ antiporter
VSKRPLSVLAAFLADEAAGGIVLIAAAALAMVAANSPLADGYFHLLHVETGPVLSPKIGPMTVHLWINDGLMAVFFLLVGLEIKRELIGGELASAEKRRLPVIAAIAGMAVPALLYLGITGGAGDVRSGWAIPAATDIAFAIGVLALAGPRVPASLKLFLTTVAIVDDMGAVVIIALFYTHGLALAALGGAVAVAAGLFALNRAGVKALSP